MYSALFVAAALQIGATGVPMPEDSPAVTAAKANRASMKTAPSYMLEPDTVVPEDAKLRGEHGEVSVAGIVEVDGRFMDTRVKSTSRSDRIDAAALRAAQEARFAPAQGGDGRPLPVYVSVTFNFDNAASLDGKAFRAYRCAQFLRDQGWWKQAWPERPRDKFGNLLAGMLISSAGTQPKALQRNAERIDAIWKITFDQCRTTPKASVVDTFFAASR